jgi:hypothetical protein
VALGHGLVGQLYSAVDSDRQLTWSMLTFSWQLPAPLAIALPPKRGPLVLSQRVTVMSVDDHRPDAPFPGPSNALADSVRAALSQVVRGSARTNRPVAPKDAELLLRTARVVVAQRLTDR